MLQSSRPKGMKPRHWKRLSELTQERKRYLRAASACENNQAMADFLSRCLRAVDHNIEELHEEVRDQK